ncbi:DUF1449 family protein [Scytonema sp. NUACC21]
MLFSPLNLPYWIFLGMGVLLFLFVICFGGGGEDVDIDVDAEINTDADGDLNFGQLLGWAGIGQAPLILLLATDLSLWGVVGWMLNVWIGSIIALPNSFFSSIILLCSLTIGVLIGSWIARPIGKIFADFSEDASGDRLIGCTGIVTSAFIPVANQKRIGQVDVTDSERNLLSINATVPEWATIIPQRGAQVIVIDKRLDTYFIVAKDSLDQENWLNGLSQPTSSSS